jgi:hypothetical protein
VHYIKAGRRFCPKAEQGFPNIFSVKNSSLFQSNPCSIWGQLVGISSVCQLASDGSTVVEHSPRHQEVVGSSIDTSVAPGRR